MAPWNNYDPFLDEHVGIESCHYEIPAVSTLLAMFGDGVSMLDAARARRMLQVEFPAVLRVSSTFPWRPTPSNCA